MSERLPHIPCRWIAAWRTRCAEQCGVPLQSSRACWQETNAPRWRPSSPLRLRWSAPTALSCVQLCRRDVLAA